MSLSLLVAILFLFDFLKQTETIRPEQFSEFADVHRQNSSRGSRSGGHHCRVSPGKTIRSRIDRNTSIKSVASTVDRGTAVRAEDLKCHTVLQLVQCDYQRPELLAGPESL
jgi:hypothetical protein